MNTAHTLAYAWRNLGRHLRRNLLTGGVVAFGFASLALAGGFMAQSFDGLREGTIRSGVGHLQIADTHTFEGSGENPLDHVLTDIETLATRIRTDTGVARIMPRLEFFGLASNAGRSIPFLGLGVDPENEKAGTDIPGTIAAGRWIVPGVQAVILGEGLARSLNVKVNGNITLLATTQDGTLNAVDVTVAGIAALPMKELNDRYLALPLTVAQTLMDAPDSATRLSVLIRPGHTPEDVAARLARKLEDNRRLGVKTWEALATFYGQVKLLYLGLFGFMGTVLGVVVFLATLNAVWMTVMERTREIGTLRALGARTRTVERLFLAEGMLLGVASCAAGAMIAYTVSIGLNASEIVLPPPPGAARGFPIQVKFFPLAYLGAGVLMLIALTIATWLPARRAARADIVASLTHV